MKLQTYFEKRASRSYYFGHAVRNMNQLFAVSILYK